jgi:hypothetical protein
MITQKQSYNPDTIAERSAMEETIEKVLEKILRKLDGFVDTAEVDKLNPQAMKHVTATLKDIRDLTLAEQPGEGQIHVIFDHPEWKG